MAQQLRRKRIAERKARQIFKFGFVKIFDNEVNAEELDWRLDKEGFLTSPDRKTKVSIILLNRITNRSLLIWRKINEIKKFNLPLEDLEIKLKRIEDAKLQVEKLIKEKEEIDKIRKEEEEYQKKLVKKKALERKLQDERLLKAYNERKFGIS
jgi:hypothetical protein